MGKEVWFDNLMVGLYKGEVTEEDHYYPFGLTIATAEDQNVTKNPLKYQGIELEKHFGLETYETFYRGLDPQLGRFNSIDPKSELDFNLSPYVSMANNPVINIDPLGDNPILVGLIEAAVAAVEVEEVIVATEVIKGAQTMDRGDGLAHQRRVIAESRQAWANVNTNISTAINSAPAMGRFAMKTVAVAKELAKNYKEAHSTNAKGRGANNRTPDPDAVGDHTVINENGTTTYTRNDNNPNKNNAGAGFETKKRVDHKGAAHVDKKTGAKTPTPHVQEQGNVRPAKPGTDMPN